MPTRTTLMIPRRVFALPVLASLVAFPSACARTPSDDRGSIHTALGESAPPLGAAASFAVLGATTVTNTGPTTVGGDLGVNPGLAITGFPPGIVVGGVVHAGDAVALQAQSDVTVAYDVLAGEPCGTDLTGIDLGGLTLVPGVYCFSSSAQLTGTLALDALGRADAVFVFKTVSTLTTASNASVRMINGGDPCRVFWQVGSSAVLGTGTAFSGSVLALASVSLATGAKVLGRTLARTGAVTMDSNAVSVASCGASSAADAGAADASVFDSGSFSADTGTGNPPDTGTGIGPDTGAVATPDSGEGTDSSAADAGAADAGPGETDTGPSMDAEVPDACCSSTTSCGAACVDLTSDSQNCGACGNVCAVTDMCIAGSCVLCP
jgi:hypothetical protein